MTAGELQKHLSRLPRVELAFLPTPLVECPRLSFRLGGPRVWMKRDDMTGLALGGNKTRMLEFWMADALQAGADTVITGAYLQSNHCRQLAAAANRLGLKAVLVLFGKMDEEEIQGNLLLDTVLGAEIVRVENGDFSTLQEDIRHVERIYRERGHRPYVIDGLGPDAVTGAASYLGCAIELASQCDQAEIDPEYIISPSGAGGTQAGLALGVKALGWRSKVLGISVRRTVEEIRPSVAATANRAAQLLRLDVSHTPEEILADDQSVGPGHGIPTEETLEAIRMVAETEGVLLDPTYTGKVMSGLIRLARKGLFRRDATVIFLHTGGAPVLFAKHQLFEVPR